MRFFKLTLSYDGTAYHGWQVQINGITIQQVLEVALAPILGCRTRVTASGRTDAGVHALGQVASFSAETRLSPDQMRRALNGSLPPDVRILQVEEAPVGFHAIRDAKGKRYRYVVWDAEQPDVFQRQFSWHVRQPLDLDRMRAAAACLLGRHDFVSFQAAGSPRATTIRTVVDLSIERPSPELPRVEFEIEADGFLYNMVRNIVGSLVEVGRGAEPVVWIAEILASRDRRRAGPTAPAHGLFLVRVRY